MHRVNVTFTDEEWSQVKQKCKELRPYQLEGTTIREILLHGVTSCNTVLRGVPCPDHAPGQVRSTPEKKEKRGKEIAPLSISQEIIGYLNEIAGATCRATAKSHRKLIQERMNDGATVEDFKTVIRKKSDEWKGTHMSSNLKPGCLFKACHFDDYLGQPEQREEIDPAVADVMRRCGVNPGGP